MRTVGALLALLPAVASFGYLALDDDGCSQGHETMDCATQQYCGGCDDCEDLTTCDFCESWANIPTIAPFINTCGWSDEDGAYVQATCDADMTAIWSLYGDDGTCTTPVEHNYHVCEAMCYGEDDDDDGDDDDDCAGAYTFYGGWYCEYGEVAMRGGCSEGTCSACTVHEVGQALWDQGLVLGDGGEGDTFDCFKPGTDEPYVKLHCDNADHSVPEWHVTQIIYSESDSTCSQPIQESYPASCEGSCDGRRRLRAGQKPSAAAPSKRAPTRNRITARVTPRAVEV